MRDVVDQATGKDNPGEDFFRTPARLKQHNEAVRKAASELSLPDGWDVVFDDEDALAEISKIPGRLERQAAYKGYALNSRPRHLVIKHKDPALNKHNMMFELDSADSSMMATPEEVNTVLNALTEFHSKLDVSNLQNVLGNSYTSVFNPTGAIDVKVGRHAPLRGRDIGVDETSKAVINAATNVHGQLYINIDRMRLFDTPEMRKEKEGFYWNEPKNSLEKLKTTLHHELGHQIQYATTDSMSPSEIKGKPDHIHEDGEVSTEYSAVSKGEHFAESIGRYISTGQATDRIKNILAKNGLIKSTESKKLPAAEDVSDYRMSHQPPTRKEATEEDGVAASLDKIDEVFPKDILDPSKQKNYSSGYPEADKEAFDVINSIKGNPDAEVTIYRGVPENVDDIQPGNWVTLSKKYAQAHIDSNVPGGKILAKKVKASDLFTNADSIQEWGWDPASPSPDAEGAPSSNTPVYDRLNPSKELKTVDDIFKYSKSKEVSDFVSSHFDYEETPENVDAVNLYVGDDNKTLDRNKNLRDGLDASGMEQLDSWTNSGTVSNPIRVYRGIVASDEVADSYVVGSTVSDKGFVSAAVNRQQASVYQIAREQDGAKGKKITFMIDLDKGTHAGVAHMGEVVLPRNTEFEVVSNKTLDSGTRVISLRVKAKKFSLSPLDNLGIDFQSATMDASGTRLPTPGAFTGEFQKIMEGAKSWKEVQDRLKGKTITYFDFETTGISDYDGQDITNDPIQLGAVQVKDGKIVKRFNVYTNPESKLSDWSAKNLGRDVLDENGNRILDENGKPKTTPVTPEWLAQQKSKNDAIKEFIEFIGPDALLGGQNVPFDIEILKRMAADAGVELNIAGTIDSKDLASLLPKYDPEKGIDGPKAPDRKTGEIKATSSLGPVANFLGFEPANWHSADGDAEDSYNLVSKIIERAAKEDNQDLSLLDFPAMKKRYEERMAEFKNVVSPNNPITENQQKALEEFSNSNNPEIAQKAKHALSTAITRGDAAKALQELHSIQPEAPSPDAEGSPDVPQLNKPLDIDLSDFDFDDDGEPDIGALDTPEAVAASALALANSTGLGMRKGKANDRVISAEPSGNANSLDGSITADKPSQQSIDIKDKVVALGEGLLTLAEQSILDKLAESGTIPKGTTPEGLHKMIEQFATKRDEMSDSLLEGRKNFKDKLSRVVASALDELSDEQIAKIKEEAFRILSGTSALTSLERGGASLDSPMLLLVDSSYKSWFPKFDTGSGYGYGIDGDFSSYDLSASGTYNDFFGWIAIKNDLVDISELNADADKLKASDKQLNSIPRPESIMSVYQRELANAIHERLKETGIEFDSVPIESLFAGYMPKARRYSNIDKKTRQELEAALKFIPKDILESAAQWLEDVHKNNARGGNAKIRLISSSTRAQFSREYDKIGGPITVLSIKGGGTSDYLHEIWHFIQLTNPNIGALENAYLYGRTADSQGRLSGKIDIYGNGKETGISQTGIVSPYTTRQYKEYGNKTFSQKNQYTEVMSTLVEDLFTNPGYYSTPQGVTAVVGNGKYRKIYKYVIFDEATNSWYTVGTSRTKINPTALYGRKISDGVDRDIKSFGIGMILTLSGLKNNGK